LAIFGKNRPFFLKTSVLILFAALMCSCNLRQTCHFSKLFQLRSIGPGFRHALVRCRFLKLNSVTELSRLTLPGSPRSKKMQKMFQ
jgi:hypothetical protein